MSCLDLLRQQACDLRKESAAAAQKYKKSVERGFATTVQEGRELLSQLKMSKRTRMQRRHSMMCNGTPLSSSATGAHLQMYNGHATGLQFSGTPYQRPVGSMHIFGEPRAPSMAQQRPQMPHYQPATRQEQSLMRHQMPQQQTLSNGPAQWAGGSAVPRGMSISQDGPGQQPRLQMTNSGAYPQHSTTQQTQPTMQRQMPPQQNHLASNGHGHWMSANATPNRMASLHGTTEQQQQMLHPGAQLVANSHVQPLAQHQLIGTKSIVTPPYTNAGGHSSVFHTPTSTPVGMRNQSQYASNPMRLPRFTAGNSYVPQNNTSYANPDKQSQLYGAAAAPNRMLSTSSNAGRYPPSHASMIASQVSTANSNQYPTAAVPQQGIPHVGIFNQPASKPVNSWGAATGQQAVQQNAAYAAPQPPQQAGDASEFFSLSEQELDEVLASLGDSHQTRQQQTSTKNVDFSAAVSQADQFVPPPGAAKMELPSGHASSYGTVTNAQTAPTTTTTMPTTGAEVIQINVPAGSQILEIRQSSANPGAYEVVTTAGTMTAYGQAPAVNQQPHHQPQPYQAQPNASWTKF